MEISQSSSRWNHSAAGVPGLASAGRTIMPLSSVPTPISVSLQIIPILTSPRSLPFLMVYASSPWYRVVPMVATITFCPAATLGAPHTMGSGSPSPTFTVVICRWSLLGCASQVSTSPTTSPFSPPRMGSIAFTAETSKPIAVRMRLSSSGVSSPASGR